MVAQTVLATIPGATARRRVQVVLVQRPDGQLSLSLRDQHYAGGIGWFDQRTLELEPCQLRQLRVVLGRDGPEAATAVPRPHRDPRGARHDARRDGSGRDHLLRHPESPRDPQSVAPRPGRGAGRRSAASGSTRPSILAFAGPGVA